MLDTRENAKPLATDGDVAIYMYGSVEYTGPLHILTEAQRRHLGVDGAREGFFSMVIEVRRGSEILWREVSRTPELGTEMKLKANAAHMLRALRDGLGF